MLGQSMGVVHLLLALVACISISYRVLGDHHEERQSDEITLEREQIFVKLEDGNDFSLMIEPDDLVQDLCDDICEYEGVPQHRMRLQLDNTQLDLGTKLSDSNIRAGGMLTLVIPENQIRRTANFTVETLDGRRLSVETQLSNSVSDLKNIITQWVGIPQAQQRLLLDGKQLKGERKLISYGIFNGTTVYYARPLEDCRQGATIFVKTLSGASIEVEVNLADTVTELKEKIWRKTGVPVGVQLLNANERVMAGEDHLCDLGLEAGSIVYMFLYSSRITSINQVAKLQEPPVSPYSSPIFREAEDVAEAEQSGRRPGSIFKDARNWFVLSGSRPGRNLDLMDPVAHLAPNPDSNNSIQSYHQTLEMCSFPNASQSDRLEAAIVRAQIKLSSAVRSYRVAANVLSSVNHRSQRPGISLGGGSTAVSSKKLVPLGADVNNWAPDAFSDSDLMRLFEVSERVQQVLARAARTGVGLLPINDQRRINRAILSAYVMALAGYPPSVEYNQPGQDEECGICRDDLIAQPAFKLPCKHAYHAECILSWATDLYRQDEFSRCPMCRKRFMFPYEALGKAELEFQELQASQNE